VGAASHDPDGAEVQSVDVGGRDVGQAMIAMGAARGYSEARGWCG
jgi:endonuclease YncB( thermonuclease family)